MKINTVHPSKIYTTHVNFGHNNVPNQQQPNLKSSNNKKRKMLLAASLVGLGVITAGILVMRKSKKVSEDIFCELKANYKRIISEFPEDEKYYKTLAQSINLSPDETYKLSPITGPRQLQSILQKASAQDFYLGQNLEGVKNRTLRINIHNHTTASDGKLSPKELIEQGARWADKIRKVQGNDGKPAFVLGITDHDTLDGAKEALKEIIKAPEKFKNLKLVLGAEISVAHTNPVDVKSPMNFELLGYCLNPFNKAMNDFLDDLKQNRTRVVSKFMNKMKEKYPNYDLNFEDMKYFHANLANMRTNGVLYLQAEYINHKMMFTDFVDKINSKIIPQGQEKLDATKLFQEAKDNYYYLKDTSKSKFSIAEYYKENVLSPILKKRDLLTSENQSLYEDIFNVDFSKRTQEINKTRDEFLPKISDVSGYIIRPKELFEKAHKSGEQGFFGIAHPGLINAGMFSEDVEKLCNFTGYDKGEHLAWRLYKHLREAGGDYFRATEANYQSYPYKNSGATHWQKYMGEEKAKEFGLLKTGGIDCHKNSLFKKHTLLSQKEIAENHLEGIV